MSNPVTIVCKLLRKGGTKVEIAKKTYHFKPESGDGTDPEIEHTCDIPFADSTAIWRLLAIKEAYVLKDMDAELPGKPKAEIGQTIGNEKVDPNAPKPIIITDGDGKQIELTALSAEDLRMLAKNEFGIEVHHKWKDQTVIAKIIEKTRGE